LQGVCQKAFTDIKTFSKIKKGIYNQPLMYTTKNKKAQNIDIFYALKQVIFSHSRGHL